MAKVKTHSEVEHLRGLVKELERENAQLKREKNKQTGQLRRKLKESRKLEHHYDNIVDEYQEYVAEEETAEIPKVAKCPECLTGSLNLVLDLNDKDIFNCNNCNFKKVVRK